MKSFLRQVFKINRTTRNRSEADYQAFREEVRGQFIALKKKGLSIPVFTL